MAANDNSSLYHWIFEGILGTTATFMALWQNRKSKREKDQVTTLKDLEISNQRIEQQNLWIQELKEANKDLTLLTKEQLLQVRDLQKAKDDALLLLHQKEIEEQKRFNLDQFNKIKN